MTDTVPVWLERSLIVAIHERQLVEYGGAEGIRDEGLLESALARPQQHTAYGEPGIPELAALYAIALARNHPFIDGNKRTAYVAMESFLILNGYRLGASDADATVTMLSMVSGETNDAEFIAWVVANSVAA